MRRALGALVLVLAGLGLWLVLGGAGGGKGGRHFKVELDNAFGLTTGADVKVAGVKAGSITAFDLSADNRALVSIELTQQGFGQFRSSVSCETRPQSLIGEYFIDCQPGETGRPLKDGAVIPVSHTASTVAPDLVNDILRLPYRQRLRILIGELGAAVAGNADTLNSAIRRAVPALRETDRLLALLNTQRETVRELARNANTVVSALADNAKGVQGFVVNARRTAELSAERRGDLQATFHKLPGLLTELRPTMAQLGRTADRQTPALQNLAAAGENLRRFFVDTVPFSDASRPSLASLGRASITGRKASKDALPTIRYLNEFAKQTPEVSKNLAIILHDLDDRSRAAENDPRAAVQLGRPGAKVGYTGLEALLMYAYNQSLAINSYDQNGHLLRVNAFADQCAPYQNAETLKAAIAKNPAFKRCESWLGPNQPGVNQPDPTAGNVVGPGRTSNTGGAAIASARRRSAARGVPAKATPARFAPFSRGDTKLLDYLLAP